MIRFFQKEWHNIEFNSFINCDKDNIATEEFYDKFYREFFKKNNSFNDLDEKWVKYKLLIANEIIKELKDKKNILSIGCGIGIVEKELVDKISTINLTAIEPSKNVSKWIEKENRINLKDGYFPDVLDNDLKFDLVFSNGIDYVFNKSKYDKFLKSIIDYGVKEYIMISVSYYKPDLMIYIKEKVKDVLGVFGLHERYQFWGYKRSINEQFTALKKAGFNDVSLIFQSDNTLMIKAVV